MFCEKIVVLPRDGICVVVYGNEGAVEARLYASLKTVNRAEILRNLSLLLW